MDANLFPGFSCLLELDQAIAEGEEGVIPPQAHVSPGSNSGAPLADNDRTGAHVLAIVALDTKPLRLAISPQPCAATTLFMRHFFAFSPSCLLFKNTCVPRDLSPIFTTHANILSLLSQAECRFADALSSSGSAPSVYI